MTSSIMQGARILSLGSAVPDLRLSNKDISKMVDTSDEWIVTRTGIKERRILTDANKSVVDLAVLASKKALNKISMDPKNIDLIILATSSPNDLFGSASQIQDRIGAKNAAAFDLTAACTGFVLAVITASQFIQNGSYSTILVIGADTLSKWTDWTDRSTCILFGDGAGAAIIQACSKENNGIIGFQINTDGRQSKDLSIGYQESTKADKSTWPSNNNGQFKYIQMNGKEVYKFAISKVPNSILSCINKLNIKIEEIDWIVLHQANQRILDTVAEKLNISSNKMITNLNRYGNTSAASIPLALSEAVELNQIMYNDFIAISGFGAGLTWGTIIIQWKC
uniref:Beta-ketoacyl-[acyl-carrier-protein] synthase III n=1 Tax=Gastroclonium compressum TaxID=1852973 RepID=A0A173FZU1_GASCM|nr:3-oxoacyl-acyl-carrier-protein synthase 3 [Coeloseira compressa]ANH09544.1 3-oxoacyl-acyl-carrier-protein synthase 3 [Coeloseira compressa]